MNRLHPLVGLVRVARYAVYGVGLPVFGLSMASIAIGEAVFERLPLLPILAVGLVIGAIYGLLSYLRYTYVVTEDTFDVRSGVLARRERDIPHGRIQNVDLTRSVWQNLLGLATVRIETAGGGSTEALLDFVSAAEAERLERVLSERRAENRADATERTDDAAPEQSIATATPSEPASRTGETAAGPDDRATPLFAISNLELALHALTTFRPGVLAFIVIGTPFVEGLVSRILLAAAAPIGGPDRLAPAAISPDELLALAVVGLPLGVASAWLLGMAIGVNQYYGFRLGRRRGELVYQRGLLSEYSGSIPLGKVQTLTVTENVFQRALGYAGLSIDTAGYAGGAEQGGERSAIPLAERDRVVELTQQLEGAELDVAFTRPPSRARERYVVRFGLVLLGIVGLSYAISQFVEGFTLWWTPAVLAPLVPIAAHLKWVHRGYALQSDHVLVRTGFLKRRTRVVPYDRLQTIVRTRSVFQRRRDLAHLVADTASGAVLNRGGAVAYDQSADTAADLQERLRERLQASLRD